LSSAPVVAKASPGARRRTRLAELIAAIFECGDLFWAEGVTYDVSAALLEREEFAGGGRADD
jgi:hypothetical protein